MAAERPLRARRGPLRALLGSVGASVGIIGLYLGISLAVLLLGRDHLDAVSATLVGNAAACLLALAGVVIWKRRKGSDLTAPPGAPLVEISPRILALIALLQLPIWAVGQASALWIQRSSPDQSFEKYQEQLSSANPVLLLLALLVAAPVTEEVLMRGLVYPRLRTIMGVWPAAALSAAAFAILHGTAVHLAYTVTFGVLLAIAYELTHRLWLPIAMHLAFNLGALVPAATVSMLARPVTIVLGNVIVGMVLLCAMPLLKRASATLSADRATGSDQT